MTTLISYCVRHLKESVKNRRIKKRKTTQKKNIFIKFAIPEIAKTYQAKYYFIC